MVGHDRHFRVLDMTSAVPRQKKSKRNNCEQVLTVLGQTENPRLCPQNLSSLGCRRSIPERISGFAHAVRLCRRFVARWTEPYRRCPHIGAFTEGSLIRLGLTA
jgi:hypothetical protein